jgi:hypothetical protein
MHEMLITSNGFQPRFPLKAELLKLGQMVNQAPPPVVGPTPSPEDDA